MENVMLLKVQQYDDELVYNAVKKMFVAFSLADKLNAGSSVVLKPNLLAKHTPEESVTTNPVVVAAVIRNLHELSVQKIKLVDSAGGSYNKGSMSAIYKASGLADVCAKYSVEIDDSFASRVVPIQGRIMREFTLLSPVLDADFVINLPKLKTHVMMGLTCATKNLFGVIPGLLKAELHLRFPEKRRFGDMLVDLAETLKPNFTIVDGIDGMQGDGPAGGSVKHCGLMIGGENVYNIDLCAAKLIGIPYTDVTYLVAANERGLCGSSFDETLLLGEQAVQPIESFELPRSYSGMAFESRIPKFLRPFSGAIISLIAPKPVIKKSLCIGCRKCAEICPAQVISIVNKKAVIAPKNCIKCFCCHEVCPARAIDVKRITLFSS